MNKYDVIIIGAGPIGLACGIEAVKRNLSHIIFDKGCVVNSIYKYPKNMTFFSTSEKLEIGGVPFVSLNNKPTRNEALEYYRRAASFWKLNIKTYEQVLNVSDDNNNEFIIETIKDKYKSKSVISSTGFYDQPNLLNVPGENLPKVKHYFDEAHPFINKNVAVIGGGNSAVDVALEIYRKEGNVTLIHHKDRIKDSVKYWVKPDIENRIKEGSIKSYFNSKIIKIKENSLILNQNDKQFEIDNDFVFAMTGYHPDFTFLRKIGIELETETNSTPCFNPNTFETNKPNLYLAGVVCSGMDTSKLFIENTRFHAESILINIEKRI